MCQMQNSQCVFKMCIIFVRLTSFHSLSFWKTTVSKICSSDVYCVHSLSLTIKGHSVHWSFGFAFEMISMEWSTHTLLRYWPDALWYVLYSLPIQREFLLFQHSTRWLMELKCVCVCVCVECNSTNESNNGFVSTMCRGCYCFCCYSS